MIKRLTKSELANLETKGATIKVRPKAEDELKKSSAQQLNVHVEPDPTVAILLDEIKKVLKKHSIVRVESDPAIAVLLDEIKRVLVEHNTTINQLAQLMSNVNDKRSVGLEGISSFRIIDRDEDGNISTIKPVMKSRH